MHPLEIILGTKTKIRILNTLMLCTAPVTRNHIAKQNGGSMHGIYEQIEILIGLGVVKEIEGKITFDPSFPYLDDLWNLFLTCKGYLGQLPEVLRRVDTLFGDDYYIGGFLAARRHVVPIDYDTNSILIRVLDFGKRDKLRLNAISDVSSSKIIAKELEHMPIDVIREEVFGAEVWIASVERGIVESFTHHDCTAYGAHLVLLQNLLDEGVDMEKLITTASESGQEEEIAATISSFAQRASIELPEALAAIGRKHTTLADTKEIEQSLNTVFG